MRQLKLSCQRRLASSRVRTKEVNKVHERFVKEVEVKREVCFTSLAWMPASEGWHEAGMTNG